MLTEALFVTALAACIVSSSEASSDSDGSAALVPRAPRGVNAALLPSRGGRNNLAGKAGSVNSRCISYAVQLMCSGNSFACVHAPSVRFFSSLPGMSFFVWFPPSPHKAQILQSPSCTLPAEGMSPGWGSAAVLSSRCMKASVQNHHWWGWVLVRAGVGMLRTGTVIHQMAGCEDSS